MYVISAHQRHRQTDRQTDVKRSHDRYIAKACSGNNSQGLAGRGRRCHTFSYYVTQIHVKKAHSFSCLLTRTQLVQ